jgi:Tol biopolymer transport system component
MALDGTLLTKNEGIREPEKNCPSFRWGTRGYSPDRSRYAYYPFDNYSYKDKYHSDKLEIGEFNTGKTINVVDLTNFEVCASAQCFGPDFYWLDNNKVSFISKDTIYILDVETGNMISLGLFPSRWIGNIWGQGVSPSPDGKNLLIESGNSESDNLFLVASDGSGNKNMTADLGIKIIDQVIGWSSDSTRFAFTADMGNGKSLVIEKADGSIVKIIEKLNDWSEPIWSPDGNHIAYGCTINSSDAYICLTDAEGNITSLQVGSHPNWMKWSPDSKKIAYFPGQRIQHYHAHIIWIDSGKDQELFSFDRVYSMLYVDQFFRWSPDSNWLLILTAGRTMYGYDLGSPVLCDLQAHCHDFVLYNIKFAVMDAEWALPISIER